MNHQSTKHPLIGEVYDMYFDGRDGSEQRGFRPGLVFQNNVGNSHSPNIIALPFTTAITEKKIHQPTHVLVKASADGLRFDSIVLCENPERMSKTRIGRYITKLSDGDMARIAEASLLSSSALSFLDWNSLVRIWRTASSLNAPRSRSQS